MASKGEGTVGEALKATVRFEVQVKGKPNTDVAEEQQLAVLCSYTTPYLYAQSKP